MVKSRAELASDEELLEEDLKDPEFRAHWEKTALARWLAIEVAHYRAEHDLSQRQLADQLGLKQPQIARIEVGEQTPSWQTLVCVARGLDLELMIDIHPEGRKAQLPRKRAKRSHSFTMQGCEVTLASA